MMDFFWLSKMLMVSTSPWPNCVCGLNGYALDYAGLFIYDYIPSFFQLSDLNLLLHFITPEGECDSPI